jgi:hypothetical protein
MTRLRCSIVQMAALLAVLALDMAVIRSLARTIPGSNQLLYLIPIDGTHWLPFLTLALGVLPMASVLVLATTSHVLAFRRGGTVSAYWIGFMAFGWLSVSLFVAVAALSPPAVQGYLIWVGERIGPAIVAVLGDDQPEWLFTAIESILCVVEFALPELSIALAGGWWIGRSGGRIGVEPRASEETCRYPGLSCGAAHA